MNTTHRRLLLGVLAVWLVAFQTTHAVNATIFVDRFDDVAGLPCTGAANDCSLRSAVQLANVTPGPDTIVLQTGTYMLTLGPADDDSTSNGAIAASGDLDIFDADGDPSQVSDLTILGTGSWYATTIRAGTSTSSAIDRIFDVENPFGSPSFEGVNFTLQSVTLNYGNARAVGSFYETGGAINFNGCRLVNATCVNRGVLTLLDVTVQYNEASGSGGGIAVQNIGGLSLTGVSLAYNTSDHGAGGGIFHLGGANDGSISIAASSTRSGDFYNNSAPDTSVGCGGAFRIGPTSPASTVSIANSGFSSNRSQATAGCGGGAIFIDGGHAITIARTNFSDNRASFHGGAIFSDLDTATDLLIISGSDFAYNRTDYDNNSTGDGGGLFVADGEVRFVNSTLRYNSAINGGGVAVQPVGGSPTLTIRNSTIAENSAKALGGGLYVDNAASGATTITNATIGANRANTANTAVPGGAGGGLARSAGAVVLQNTIVGGNFFGSSGSTADDGKATGGVTADYSLIQTTTNFAFTGGNNVTGQDPRLGGLGCYANCSNTTSTIALLSGSPALDAGSNALAAAAGLSTDQRGVVRVADSADADSIATADIGAFEAVPTVQEIPDIVINEDAPLAISFNVGDSTVGFSSIMASSNNWSVMPSSNISISGSGSTRTLSAMSAANQAGVTTITVYLTASASAFYQSVSETFLLTVNPVDDPPAAQSVVVPSFTQSSGAHVITLSATDVDSTNLAFSIVTQPTKGTLGPTGPVTCSSGLPSTCTTTVTYTPNLCAVSSDTFWYRANDGSMNSNVASVNIFGIIADTQPVITSQPTDATVADTYVASFQATATGCSPGAQWQVSQNSGASWSDIPGANSPTYSFVAAPSDSGKWFRAVFTYAGKSATTTPATLTVTPFVAPGRSDFTGDGKPDIVWQDPNTGAVLLWQMDGPNYVSSTMLSPGGTLWKVVGTGDFTGDGKPDLLWQHPSTGAVLLWQMDGADYVGGTIINQGGTLWKIVGVGDFTADSKLDLLWQHPATGAVLLWQMNGTTYVGGAFVNAGGTFWQVVGAADFTGDGHDDVLWQYPGTGAVLLWQMNGPAYVSSTILNPGGTMWQIVANGDYTGDGKTDLLWQDPSTGAVLLWQMDGSTYVGGTVINPGGTLWSVKGPR